MASARLQTIDGIRGHLLLGMMICHLHVIGAPIMGSWLGIAHHRWIVGFWDAEFFVAVSGLMCGLLAQRRFGLGPALRSFLLSRLRLVFLYVVGLQVLVGSIEGQALPGLAGLGRIVLMDGPSSLSATLDLYVWCFVFLIGSLLLTQRIAGLLAIAALLYGAATLVPMRGLLGYGAANFNVPAWYAVFALAFAAGAKADAVVAAVAGWDAIRVRAALLAAAAVWIGARLLAGGTAFGATPDTISEARDMLGPLRLLSLAGFCAAFALVLRFDALPPLARALRAWFALPLLQDLGRRSIQAFAFHSVLIAVFAKLMRPGDPVFTGMLALAMLSLFLLFPALHDRVRALRARMPIPARVARPVAAR